MLDKDYVIHRVKQTSEKKFEKVESIDLSRHKFVKSLVDDLKPFEPISISDRTITRGGSFVNFNSGKHYSLLDPFEFNHDVGNCMPVANSDMIIVKVTQGWDNIRYVVVKDPGTRRVDTIG